MAFPLIQPPKPFEPGSNPAETWSEWKTAYELYEAACEYTTKPPATRRALLLHVIGPAARKIVDTFSFTAPASGEPITDTVAAIFAKFDEKYLPYKNVTQAAAVFNCMYQKENQPVDDFIAELQCQSRKCDFGDQHDRLLGDRIIIGIRDAALRERLFRERDLTLEKIITTCRAAEISKQHVSSLATTLDKQEVVVDNLNRGRQPHRQQNRQQPKRQPRFQQRSNQPQHSEAKPQKSCGRCGTTHLPRQCPAYGTTCYACGKFGHFQNVCRQKQRAAPRHVRMLDMEEDVAVQDFGLGSLTVNDITEESLSDWLETVNVSGNPVTFKLDTGSDVNILPEQLVSKWKPHPAVKKTKAKVTTYLGEQLDIENECQFLCTVKNTQSNLKFLLVKGNLKPILGASACTALDLLHRVRLVEATKKAPHPASDFEDVLQEFPDVFKGIGRLPGEYSIHLKPDVKPTVTAPRRVPSALEETVKAELAQMEHNGIITAVTEPTDWVHPIVIITKKDGTVRICLDPRNLNAAVKRHHYRIPVPEELFAQLSGCTVFSVLDAKSAFWQLALDEESSYLCTFATPWGRYRFRRVPFGLSTAPELFQQAIDRVFERQTIVMPYFDDILVASRTSSEHTTHLRKVLMTARNNNLKLNKDKLKLGLSSVTYLGHQLTQDGIAPDPDKVKAINAIQPPTEKAELLRFLGMATYLMKFVPNFSSKTQPLRELLKSDVAWHWTREMSDAFNEIKGSLTTAPVLHYFDPAQPIVISTDASSYGIGSVLLQNGFPVAYASAALTPAQQRYAQIEKELLAVVFACEQFYYYICGRSIVVETDHKPLIGLHKKDFHKVSPRLQRLLLRIQRFTLKLVHIPGKLLAVADALSRTPDPAQSISTADEEHGVLVCTLVRASTAKLAEIQASTAADDVLKRVMTYIEHGWPNKISKVHPSVKPFYSRRSELYVTDGFVCYGERLVVPQACQKDVLSRLHITHRGIVACKNLASQSVFWPRLNQDIEELISGCEVCQRHQRANQKEPLLDRDLPTRPWEKVAMDFFHHSGTTYLLVVDYYSKFVEVEKMPTTTASALIAVLKDLYARHGIPNEIVSDQGPPFDSAEYRSFNKEWDIVHNPSSPLFPRSNGQAERTIQTIKATMTKALSEGKDLALVLMTYRATPSNGLPSPAEMLMGRRIRTLIPASPSTLLPHYPHKSFSKQLQARQRAQHKHGDQHAQELPPLHKKQPVWFWHGKSWRQAVVTQVGPAPRRYKVTSSDGQSYARNRHHLRIRTCSGEPKAERNQEVDSRNPQLTAEDYYPLDFSLISSDSPSQSNPRDLPLQAQQRQTRSGRSVRVPSRFLY